MILYAGIGYVAPQPNPSQPIAPRNWPRTLSGVRQAYTTARNDMKAVLTDLKNFGAATDAIQSAQSVPAPDDLLLAAADSAQATLQADFQIYTTAAQAAQKIAGEYMSHVWYVSQADSDAVNAVMKLPRDIAGIKPNPEEVAKWTEALQKFADGADTMARHADTVLSIARETHDVLEQVLRYGGMYAMATTGLEILAAKGCEAFIYYSAQQIASLAEGVAINYAASYALQLATELGLSPTWAYWIRVGADAYQTYSFFKAAKAQRAARGAGCFAAGTEVVSQYGSTPIEQIHPAQRVMTQVDMPLPALRRPVATAPPRSIRPRGGWLSFRWTTATCRARPMTCSSWSR